MTSFYSSVIYFQAGLFSYLKITMLHIVDIVTNIYGRVLGPFGAIKYIIFSQLCSKDVHNF
jgi:hypothetical protein